MLRRGARLIERDLIKDPLDLRELRRLFDGQDPGAFLNPRHALYRTMGMKKNPPSPDEIIRLMAKEPGLIRRPLVVREGRMVAGYDEMGLARLLR